MGAPSLEDRARSDFRAGTALLHARRYAEAWLLYDARKRVAGFDCRPPITDAPEWFGEDPCGLHIAVCAEQGFGDQLMFGRWLSRLSAHGAEVTVLCHPSFLGRLYESAGISHAPYWTDRPLPACDRWTHIGSLPLRLGEPNPPSAAYLPFRDLPGGGIGVMARGNPRHWNDAARSLSQPYADELLSLGLDLSPEATGAAGFMGTAEIIMGLDLVVTVDTAVAHLAGAMGKPCVVLLPFSGLDWRWNDGVRSDWYPDFTLLRQPAPGDWRSVLDQLRARIA